MNDPDAEYAHVKKLAGAQLKRWLVATVEVDEEDAEVVLAEKITGRDLLTTSDLDRLLESVKLKAGPRSRIAEKVKELKGDLRSCCFPAALWLAVFSSREVSGGRSQASPSGAFYFTRVFALRPSLL